VTLHDHVRLQHMLLTERLGVAHIKPNFRTVSGSIAQDARNSAGLQGG
jgi:hypothetical protein